MVWVMISSASRVCPQSAAVKFRRYVWSVAMMLRRGSWCGRGLRPRTAGARPLPTSVAPRLYPGAPQATPGAPAWSGREDGGAYQVVGGDGHREDFDAQVLGLVDGVLQAPTRLLVALQGVPVGHHNQVLVLLQVGAPARGWAAVSPL